MAAPGPYSFKTNVGRSVTKKWRDASQISYEGDDWGEDDEYPEYPEYPEYDEPAHIPAASSNQPGSGFYSHALPTNRSVTNPSPSRGGRRLSFDRGDDRRTFSSGTFESSYPNTQRQPFPGPSRDFDPPFPSYNGPAPLRVDTQSQEQGSAGGFRPSSRGRNFSPHENASGGVPFPQQRTPGSNSRPPPGDPYSRHDSPIRPGSRGSLTPSRQFPPRKQSLTSPPPLEFIRPADTAAQASAADGNGNNDHRPIPMFIRPADIYQRHSEEMDRARKSQESSRPSIDFETGRVRGNSMGTRSTTSESNTIVHAPDEEPDSARRLKPMALDTVPERKSEYGFDNMLKQAVDPSQPEDKVVKTGAQDSQQPTETAAGADVPGISRHSTNTSSVYTDRPDPVSATSVSRTDSLNEGALDNEKSSLTRPSFNLPPIDRMSGFGVDLGLIGKDGNRNGAEPRTDNSRLDTGEQAAKSDAHSLHHQPSLGYRSMVQQAFEESEKLTPFSPTNSDVVNRSNSTSTLGISPIIDRKQQAALSDPPTDNTQPAIPEESSESQTRPTSTATLRPHNAPSSQYDAPVPPALQVGYRRDVSPTGHDNSPAKRPVSIEHPISIQPQQGSMETEKDERSAELEAHKPVESDADRNFPIESPVAEEISPQNQPIGPPAPPTERTTSEEWQEWQAQKKLFNTQAGFSDSGPVTPHLPSPIRRSETPAKGTVRELAGKLETHSGRSTPSNSEFQVTSPVEEQQRPAPQPRFESFRPSIPGGWQSYTSTASAQTPGSSTPGPQQQPGGLPQHAPRFALSRPDSTESIPTAKAPTNTAAGVAEKAFAAAATAGSALATALTGHPLRESVHDSQEPTDDSSENEWDSSSSDGQPGSDDEQRTLENKFEDDRSTRSVEEPSLGKPPSTEQPSEGTFSGTVRDSKKSEPKGEASGSDTDDMPAPLRTGRVLDGSSSRARMVDVSLPQASPGVESDNERLQQEIEKSLSPRISTFYGEVTASGQGSEKTDKAAPNYDSTSTAKANQVLTATDKSQPATSSPSAAPVEQTRIGVSPAGTNRPSSVMHAVQTAESKAATPAVGEQPAAENKAPLAAQLQADRSDTAAAPLTSRGPVLSPAEAGVQAPASPPMEPGSNTQNLTTMRPGSVSPPTVSSQLSQSTQNVPIAPPDSGVLEQRRLEAAPAATTKPLPAAPVTSDGESQADSQAGPPGSRDISGTARTPSSGSPPGTAQARSNIEPREINKSGPLAADVQTKPITQPGLNSAHTQPTPTPQGPSVSIHESSSTPQQQPASSTGLSVPMTTADSTTQARPSYQQRPFASPTTAPVAVIQRGPSPQLDPGAPSRPTGQTELPSLAGQTVSPQARAQLASDVREPPNVRQGSIGQQSPPGQRGMPTGIPIYTNVTEPTPSFMNAQSQGNAGTPPVPFTSTPNDVDTTTRQHQQQPSEQGTSTATRPFIQQRFSWETSSEVASGVPTPKPSPSPQPRSPPGSIGTQIQSSPASQFAQAPVGRAPGSPDVTQPYGRSTQPTTEQHPVPSQYAPTTIPNSSQAAEPVSLRNIMNLSSPEERIRAYNETRAAYATSDGQLENWLMALRSDEHSDVFATDGRGSQDLTDFPPHRTPPRRTLTESAGARQMQEDGKRLMAKAGKFGGKAGSAAKGLFAKGKEKMRQVSSSGEKGSPAVRRRSTGLTPVEPESEDSLSPSQTRESKFADRPPQLPLTLSPVSPTDWFSGPTLGASNGELSRAVQPEEQSSPNASIKNDTKRTEDGKEGSENHAGPVTAVAPTALSVSPAISALDSDQHEHADGPSRSISQITRPTDEHSPVEPPHRSIADEISDRGSPVVHPSIAISERDRSDANTVTPPRSFIGTNDGLTPKAGITGGGLHVPEARRRSVISGVSSASPGTGSEASGDHLDRSVSPADEAYGTTERDPHENAQAPSNEAPPAESIRTEPDRPTADIMPPPKVSNRDEALPPGMAEPHRTSEDSKPVVETVENVPRDREQVRQTADNDESGQARPFSYAGLEGIGEVHQSQESSDDLRQVPTQPLSPVSQTLSNRPLSKEMSQVSVDEVFDQSNAGSKRQSRSYSRPFGVDPNVRNHPALRTPEPEQPPMDRAQMYSSESPLPSARRRQEDLDRLRQQREQFQPDQRPHIESPRPGDFRIPGPYIQEYRSPKQISVPRVGQSPVQVEPSSQPLPSARRSQQNMPGIGNTTRWDRASYISGQQQYHQQQQGEEEEREHHSQRHEYPPEPQFDMKPEARPDVQQQERAAQPDWQPMGPPPLPAPTTPGGRKKSTFGGLFGSKSRTKLQKHDRGETPVEDNNNNKDGHKREKRSSLFRRNSRHDSISSTRSSQYGAQDQIGRHPPSNATPRSGRRLSRDLLRGPTPEPKDQPTEGKKKRWSGLGGLFKSGGGASKASTLPAVSAQAGNQQQQTPSETFMSPQAYSAQTPYGQFSDVPGGFFDMDAGQYPASLYTQNSHQQRPSSHYESEPYPQEPSSQQQHPSVPAPFYNQATVYPDSQPPQDLRRSQSPYPPRTPPHSNTERRPADLRIDTGGSHRNSYGMPATAPAQMHPHHGDQRTFSTTVAPDAARAASPAIRSATTPTPRAGSQRPISRDHVFDLHKRSRSPRLGRRSSDEDLDAPQQQQPRRPDQQQQPPVATLGTFSSKKISPAGGIPRDESEQERPFAIGIPGLDEEDERKRRLRERIEGAAAGRSDTPVSIESQGHHGKNEGGEGGGDGGLDRNVSVLDPSRREPSPTGRSKARDKSSGFIAELPGSRAAGYESEEEIPMSATAYPGQEWVPVMVGDGRWDD